jgi:signal transduction histidine kinase
MAVSDILRRAFPTLTEPDLVRMTSHAEGHVYPPGVRLCNEGEMEETFYVLEDGTVEVFVQISPEETLLITELGPGDCFGEMGLVANQPRSATVRTTSECRVLEIDKQTLESVLVNNPHLVLSMMRQISRNLWNNDRKTIEAIQAKNEVLARAYADLESQIKMRSQFIATLSHELRTPLTAAQGFLHLINSGVVPAEQQGAALAKVTRNVEQVVAITNTLLILHEIDLISPRLAPMHLTKLVDEIILEVTRHRELPASAVLNQIPDDFGAIQADEASLGLALRCLIDNAVKFSGQSPPVVTAERDDQGISIQVSDRGIGMSPETLTHLFEPFYKAEGTGGASLFDGLGIGLVMARFIIERHGGTITATSRPGQGSTFTIHLPLPEEE